MGNSIRRVIKATLKSVSDKYIDFIDGGNDYFAFVDEASLEKQHYEIMMMKFREAIRNDSKVNLVLERKSGKYNKKQLMDYVVKAEFY